MRTAALVLGAWLLALPALAAPKPHAGNDAESEARAAFSQGRYADALAGYQRLYDDTRHPTYLRNVGRCQQMLKDPDRAIASFREYLRISPELSQTARDEVEGFIRDMQELKRQRGEAASPKATRPPPKLDLPPPQPRAGGVDATIARPADHASDHSSDHASDHTWAWAAGGGALVAAGVVVAVLLLQGPKTACPSCTLPKVSIDTR
jgi:tetratricopeptide (TPR) repeat protein